MKRTIFKVNQQRIGKLMAQGRHYKVREYGEGKVLKIPVARFGAYDKRAEVETAHYKLLKKYLGDNIPKTTFIKDQKGRQVVVQDRIEGKPLASLTKEEIFEKTNLRDNLLSFVNKVLILERIEDHLPELFGGGQSVLTTDNIMVTPEDKVYYVDLLLINKGKIKWWNLRSRMAYFVLLNQLKYLQQTLGKHKVTNEKP